MRLDQAAARLGFAFMAVLSVGYLLQLSHRANGAMRAQVAAAASGRSPADMLATERQPQRLVVHLDRGVAPSALGEGWSGAEPNFGVWSVGRRSVVRLTGLPPGAAQVALTLEPFVAPSLPAQRLTVRAQGRALGEWSLGGRGVRTLHVEVPADARGAAGELVLELDLPDAAQPARHVAGSKDAREIAVNLKAIEASAGDS